MRVRMKIGPKSGLIVDLPYSAGANLVDKDQGEDVDDLLRLPKPQASRVDAATVENAAPMGESATNARPAAPHHVELVGGRIGTKKKNR